MSPKDRSEKVKHLSELDDFPNIAVLPRKYLYEFEKALENSLE